MNNLGLKEFYYPILLEPFQNMMNFSLFGEKIKNTLLIL
ncbi:hypothetical protein JBKA6_1281 [Ichthyobacterium seriolicida]|uniref:Uncharacterized protein n=1 Tax=Ichthyobacterium seriolicida TaxID=242600 RepID=A0A1J1E7I7_9FLAO|nr:hypothetical protein JBKA6_1281 [Ichthyobacterium seriolicida]